LGFHKDRANPVFCFVTGFNEKPPNAGLFLIRYTRDSENLAGKNLTFRPTWSFVVLARVFFLSFPKRYVVGDTANSSVSLGILLSHLNWNTDWHRRNAARPIKLDVPCPNILLGFLHGISGIPRLLRRNATPSNKGQYESA
jgi:hypothetical protein